MSAVEGWDSATHTLHAAPCLQRAQQALHAAAGGAGGVNVALPTNIAAEDAAKVIDEAELVGMACSVDELAALAPVLGACRTLRTFIVMDHAGCPSPQLPALVKQARAASLFDSLHALASSCELCAGTHGCAVTTCSSICVRWRQGVPADARAVALLKQ